MNNPNNTSINFIEIKNSDTERNDFIEQHKAFVAKIASKHCGRFLAWGQDDELSIGLIALNQAIDAYQPDMNVPFLAFARTVIERKLTDYFRKEKRHNHLPLIIGENEDSFMPGEINQAWDDYHGESLKNERLDEITQFSKLLATYNIKFADLEMGCPKHQDSRRLLTQSAYKLSTNHALLQKLLQKRQLPVKELAKICGLSPKTIEKARKYIVATALLLHFHDEFLHLREFVQITKERGT